MLLHLAHAATSHARTLITHGMHLRMQVHTQPGGELTCCDAAHILCYEGGGITFNSVMPSQACRGAHHWAHHSSATAETSCITQLGGAACSMAGRS
mmetsp:Transcript_20580/g.52240  ORF Transcript_20580/g.52240 Transcript_20580/m.52240 type:complete len:96 (-) Transcript_20580:2089-2376(-)